MNKIQWEEIYLHAGQDTHIDMTYRAKVFGGWIIRHKNLCNYRYDCDPDIEDEGYQTARCSMIFISDPNHEWNLN